jgi:hypothetical protein
VLVLVVVVVVKVHVSLQVDVVLACQSSTQQRKRVDFWACLADQITVIEKKFLLI